MLQKLGFPSARSLSQIRAVGPFGLFDAKVPGLDFLCQLENAALESLPLGKAFLEQLPSFFFLLAQFLGKELQLNLRMGSEEFL